jgi:hypothetical protein
MLHSRMVLIYLLVALSLTLKLANVQRGPLQVMRNFEEGINCVTTSAPRCTTKLGISGLPYPYVAPTLSIYQDIILTHCDDYLGSPYSPKICLFVESVAVECVSAKVERALVGLPDD